MAAVVLVRKSIFTPNLSETPSAREIAAIEAGTLRPEDTAERGTLSGEGVRLQLTRIRIVDGLQSGPFFPRAKGVYLITTVVDGVSSDPITFQGKVYRDIVNGMSLPLGPDERDPGAVFTVYSRTDCPNRILPPALAFNVLVLRSNQDMRDLGKAITSVIGDDRFKKLSDLVTTAVAAANPAYNIVWQVAQEAIGLLGALLSNQADTQLGYYAANYTNLFDHLGKGHHPKGKGTTMRAGKIEIGYQIDVA